MSSSDPSPKARPRSRAEIGALVKSPKWNSLGFDVRKRCADVVKCVISSICGNKLIGRCIEVSVLLADDQVLKGLSTKYRDIESATNVLSFAFIHDIKSNIDSIILQNKHIFLGDIAISYERVAEESLQQMISFVDHFDAVLVHGALHLFGYQHNDEIDFEEMRNMENIIIQKLIERDNKVKAPRKGSIWALCQEFVE